VKKLHITQSDIISHCWSTTNSSH